MAGAKDIVGISVPFAAGGAAGAVVLHFLRLPDSRFPVHCAAAILSATIAASALATVRTAGNDTPARRLRLAVAGIFMAAGLFCYLNFSMLEGIPGPGKPLLDAAAKASDALKERIDSIPYPSSSTAPLVKAMLTGDRTGLDRGTTDVFRKSGASHILALSGLHLGVIYLIMLHLLRPLGNSLRARKVKYLCIILGSGYYTLMTGASPSITRAFLFISINETGKVLGRERDPSGVFLGALTVQLAINPAAITTVGFQLSYLAMAGIFFIYPALERLYPEPGGGPLGKADPLRRIWKAAVMSVSCQAATAPLAWHYFHSFPRYFIITNLVALPVTSAVMLLSVATVALSSMGICPDWLVSTGDFAVQALLQCLGTIASL